MNRQPKDRQTKPLKTFTDMTVRQRGACYAFSKKWGVDLDTVAGHLDDFFNLADGVITPRELEEQTGIVVFDYTQPTLGL